MGEPTKFALTLGALRCSFSQPCAGMQANASNNPNKANARTLLVAAGGNGGNFPSWKTDGPSAQVGGSVVSCYAPKTKLVR